MRRAAMRFTSWTSREARCHAIDLKNQPWGALPCDSPHEPALRRALPCDSPHFSEAYLLRDDAPWPNSWSPESCLTLRVNMAVLSLRIVFHLWFPLLQSRAILESSPVWHFRTWNPIGVTINQYFTWKNRCPEALLTSFRSVASYEPKWLLPRH